MCQTKLFESSALLVLFFIGFSRAEPQCERINKTISDQLQCGYNFTVRFKFERHFNMGSQAIVYSKSQLKNCSTFVNIMICSLWLPRCTEEIKGPYLPCRGVCYDYANECSELIRTSGLEWTVAMCDFLPEKDNPQTTQGYRGRCFTPPNYKDSGKGLHYKHNCSDIVIPVCKGIPGFTKTVLSQNNQRRVASAITSLMKYNASEPCSRLERAILCTNFVPGCVEGTAGFYAVCRDECLRFFKTCKSSVLSIGSEICMEYPKREGSQKLPVCKQNQWPRSENWQLPENPTKSTGTSESVTVPTTKVSGTRRNSTTDSGSNGPTSIQANKGGRMSAGTISGIVLGVIVILVAIVVGFILFRRYKQIKSQDEYSHSLVANTTDEL